MTLKIYAAINKEKTVLTRYGLMISLISESMGIGSIFV